MYIHKIALAAAAFAASACILPAKAQNANSQRPDPTTEVREVLDRVFNYIDGCTPAELVDGDGKVLRNPDRIDENSSFRKGDFGINTYEWGVTYSGLLLASEVTGDEKYADYVYDRLNFIGSCYLPVKEYYDATGYNMRLKPLTQPKWLDDCGAMTAAMIKATLADPRRSKDFRALLDNWFTFVMYEEYRMGDGILARHRPVTNSVWLDDMYMGITPIAFRGLLSAKERGDLTQKFYNEAVNQVMLFKKYLWVPEKQLFRHGWIESMGVHPSYHWARANGWAMLTLCDVLDALPENVQGRDELLSLLKELIEGVVPYQAPNGLWHQLLDKTESYLETSASAMYVYCIAHAVNEGWIDRTAYQDIAKSGWKGVASQVNGLGQVENTCVGTGLGWTNTFYENRPVSVYAAHGYGPVILAASEIIRLYENTPARRPSAFALNGGTPREDGKPMIFLAGDSTCKNGRGTGDNGQWGWGSFFSEYVSDGATVENDAVGGLSSRTFFNNRWPEVRDRIREGDFVLIQFGHNDRAPLNSGRARGTLDGTSDEPETVVMEKNGAPEDVYSYGHYIRMMIRQTKLRGGIPIVLSPTPLNSWKDNRTLSRYDANFNAWCRQVAEEEGVAFIDFNDIAAGEYEKIGRKTAQSDYFADSVHTFEKGARLYCDILARELKNSGLPIAGYIR